MALSMERVIKTLISTGRYTLGSKSSLKSLKRGRAKLVIIAENAPRRAREKALYYAGLANIPVLYYKGRSVDLGLAAGKPFKVSMIAVLDEGSSRILELAKQPSQR